MNLFTPLTRYDVPPILVQSRYPTLDGEKPWFTIKISGL
jgi:hypothetical protein